MTRKILYSAGFGAGWASWATGGLAEKKFMLEHPGLVAATLSARAEGSKVGVPLGVGPAQQDIIDRCNAYGVDLVAHYGSTALAGLPYGIAAAVPDFVRDWIEKFGTLENFPYLGGLSGLNVKEVADDDLVKIEEYDGSESVLVKSSDAGWL